MRQWHGLLSAAAAHGDRRADRTGVGTRAVFGVGCEFDLREGFPAVTTKRLAFGQVAAELAAFLDGAEGLDEFHAHGCKVWDGNGLDPRWAPRAAYPGHLGRVYGAQWRRWRSWSYGPGASPVTRETDQIAALVEGIRRDPYGRRHLVTAWNPGELGDACLPACHAFFQCFCADGSGGRAGWLDLQFYMRSVDLFLGAPFDIASYALLLHLLARATDRAPRRLVMHCGDAHVYLNHLDAVEQALARDPMPPPALDLSEACGGTDGFRAPMARLSGYRSHDHIPAKLNV